MFLSAFQSRRFLAIIVLCASILSACQQFPARSTEVENQNSQALSFVIDTKDIPGKWSWSSITVNQPSQATWITHEDLSDSAASYLKGYYWLAGKRYYVSVFHNIAQYSKLIPETESVVLHSVFEGSKPMNLPNLLNLGDKTEVACFDSSEYYDCTVIANYQFIKSFVTVIVPKELGIEELENLMAPILKANNAKIERGEQE